MNLQNEAFALDLIGYDCFSHSSLWFLPHTKKILIQFTWRQSTNSIKSEPFSFSFISPLFIAIYTLSVMQIDVFLVFQMTSKSSTRRVMIYWLVCIENVWPKLLPINLTAMQKKTDILNCLQFYRHFRTLLSLKYFRNAFFLYILRPSEAKRSQTNTL